MEIMDGKFTTELKKVHGGESYRPNDQTDTGRELDAKFAKAGERMTGRNVKTTIFDPLSGSHTPVPDSAFAVQGRKGFSFKEAREAEKKKS